MAIIKRPPHDDGPVNAGEKRLLDYLSVKLPNNYFIIPNCNIAITGPNCIMKYWEYDCIVVTPHALYHIENKDWAGNLEGDDYAWFRNGQEVVNPHKTAGLKSRILASKIKNQHPDWNFVVISDRLTIFGFFAGSLYIAKKTIRVDCIFHHSIPCLYDYRQVCLFIQ